MLYLLFHTFSFQSDRLKKVQQHLDNLNTLCLVLGMDFKHTVAEVHPSFGDSGGSRDMSNQTIQHLATAIHKLREVKIQRMQKVILPYFLVPVFSFCTKELISTDHVCTIVS